MFFSLLSLVQLGLWSTKYIQNTFRTIAMKWLLMSSSLAIDDSVKTLKNKFNLWKHQKVLLRETFINFSKFNHHIFLPRMKLMDENHLSVSSSGSFPQRESLVLRALNMSVRRNHWAYKLALAMNNKQHQHYSRPHLHYLHSLIALRKCQSSTETRWHTFYYLLCASETSFVMYKQIKFSIFLSDKACAEYTVFALVFLFFWA